MRTDDLQCQPVESVHRTGRAHRPERQRLPWPRCADDGTPLGIDVSLKAKDIQRLVTAGFAKACRRIALDDLVQQTYEAILRRNQMPSAFDPRQGSFGHYVHLVAGCQLANMLEAARRHPLVSERAPEEDEHGKALVEKVDPEADELGADERLAAGEALNPAAQSLWRLALDARAVSGPQLGLFGVSAMDGSSPDATLEAASTRPEQVPEHVATAARPHQLALFGKPDDRATKARAGARRVLRDSHAQEGARHA
jgi:hypothetical protein